MAIVKRMDRHGKPRYMVRVESTDPLTGRRKRVTVGTFGTKREAEVEHAKAVAERERGTLIDRDTVTIADLMADWLASKSGEISANSLRDYEIVVRRHILPALGHVRVQKLTAARVEAQYAAWTEVGMSPRMVRGCHMRLSQALNRAVRFGVVASNVCDSVRPPRLGRPKAATWTPDESSVFLETAKHRPVLNRAGDTGRRRPDTLWPLWPLLLREGMRRGEALGLRWRDIDWSRAQRISYRLWHRTSTTRGARLFRPAPRPTLEHVLCG